MLQSERLLFVPWIYDDFDELFTILHDERVCEYLPIKGKYEKEHIEKWLNHFVRQFDDELGNIHFKVIEKDTSETIGYAGHSYVSEFKEIEIMYGLHHKYWGKGYGTEVSKRMKNLAISRGLKKIIALADINNTGSNKILLKTGYKEIKQLKIWGLDCYYYEQKL